MNVVLGIIIAMWILGPRRVGALVRSIDGLLRDLGLDVGVYTRSSGAPPRSRPLGPAPLPDLRPPSARRGGHGPPSGSA